MKEPQWENFTHDHNLVEGWYAIHYGWDPEEGSFVQALYFDGKVFSENLPVIDISNTDFENEHLAGLWADNNDYITG